MQSRSLLLLLMLATGVLVCAGYNVRTLRFWQMSLEQNQGHLELDCEAFNVVFDGVDVNSAAHGGGASVSLQFVGSGTSILNLFAFDQSLTTSYSSGVNTITIKQYEIKILGEGKRIQFGDTTFDLGTDQKSFVVHADGTAEAK